MGGGWRSRCLRDGGGDGRASRGRGVAVVFWSRATPSFVVLVSCLVVTLCKAVVCTGLLTSESRLAASSSMGGGRVCASTGQRINVPALFSETQGVCVL